MIAQAWRGLCAISAGDRRVAAGARLIVEAAALLVDPDVAGHEAEGEAPALRGIAVIGRRVHIEPDVIHVREIAADLPHHLVAGSGGIAPGAFQDHVVAERRIELNHHVAVRVEAAGRHHHGLAFHRHRLAGLGVASFKAGDAAVGAGQPRDLGVGDDLAALLAEAVDQMRHQAEAVAVASCPAHHRVAFLLLQVGPCGAQAFGPVIEIVQTVLDVVARPHLVGRRTAPTHPIVERQVRRVVDAVLFLQRRTDDQAAAARDDGGAARFGVLLECDGASTGVARLNAGRNAGTSAPNDGNISFVVFDA